MKAATIIFSVFLGIFAVSCSSAPAAPDRIDVRKNQAADYLQYGKNAFSQAQFDQALTFFQYALDLNTAVDNIDGMAVAWHQIALTQSALGQDSDAESSLAKALDDAKTAKDQKLSLQITVSQVQNALDLGKLQVAQDLLTAQRPFADTAEGAALYHAEGLSFKASNQLTEALQSFQKALSINQRLNQKQEQAANLFMIAAVWGRQNSWDQAGSYLQKALRLDKDMENTLGIGQDLRALGIVAQHQSLDKEAFDYFERAQGVFQAAALDQEQIRTLNLLIPLAKDLKNQQALERYSVVLQRLMQRTSP